MTFGAFYSDKVLKEQNYLWQAPSIMTGVQMKKSEGNDFPRTLGATYLN